MEFETLSLENMHKLTPMLDRFGSRMCDYTPSCLYMWAIDYEVAFSLHQKGAVIRSRNPQTHRASYSVIGEINESLAVCRDIVLREGALSLSAVTAELRDALTGEYGERASVSFDPIESDYIYRAEDMRTLAGRKFSQKRNHINAFLRERSDYGFEDINKENIGELRAYYEEFQRVAEDDSESAHDEGRTAWRIIDNFFSIPTLDGLILRVDGKIVGFSIAEKIGDTLFIHIEKAERAVRGAYPMLVREMAMRHPDAECVNREEDDGDEGLRKSKLSYNPIYLLEKYNVDIK